MKLIWIGGAEILEYALMNFPFDHELVVMFRVHNYACGGDGIKIWGTAHDATVLSGANQLEPKLFK